MMMLGQGWFPDQLGGLNRYYRELLLQLPEARGLVLGPAADAPARVDAVSDHDAPLLRRLAALTRAARRDAPDAAAVDAHFALYAVVPLLSGAFRGKPLLVHFQGPWADENVAAGDHSRRRRQARRRLERAVYGRADAIVTLTGAFKRILVEQYGITPWRVAVLAPGVDANAFSPGDRDEARRQLGLADDAFVACCARRLVPRMGIDILLAAWAETLAADADARLLIAGDGDEREALQREVAAHGLSGSVTLLGRVPDQTLLALYRAADVNVVPTLAIEGFGLIVLEAAACGTPSIVTDAGGLPEAIAGLGDLIVPAGESASLGDRLMRARAGELPTRRVTRAWALRHSWPAVAEAHRTLLERIAGRRSVSGKRLRVVYLDHVAELSGGELALLRLLPALDGVEAHVITAEDGPFVARLIQAGISAEVLPMPDTTRRLRKSEVRGSALPPRAIADTALYTLRLAWRLRRLRPDLVHTNSMKSGVYGSLAARLAGVPVLWHVRDRVEPDYLPRAAVYLVRTMTRLLPHAVVSNSVATRASLRRRRRSVVVGEALGVTIASNPPERGDEQFIAVMVGRLAPWKGQDVFLRAFAEAFPHGPARAVIVGAPLFGEDEQAFSDGLRALAAQLGIADRVEFRGHRNDIDAELRAATVLVHASLTPEPFGQVVIEGMAAGLPVVATRGGGPEELISDGVNGLLYRAGDAAELAGLLRALSDDPTLRRRLGQSALARALDFTPERIATEMLAAYELVLRGST
jgi:glycosyltransferase involved in cell wall biosynthesis